MKIFDRLSTFPPMRPFWRLLLKRLPTSIRTSADWDLHERPNYLLGVLTAADQALQDEVHEISVIEFGVSGGNGLLALEDCAAAVERETGVRIHVFGFDTGGGLPELCGDHRDHPDIWRHSDYPMDVEALRSRLGSRTQLILGNIKETVPNFVSSTLLAPIGFVSIDVDLYSSTRDALQVFSGPRRRMLRRVCMYFDDVAFTFCHRFAGELLAITEFNESNDAVKIDRWRGLGSGRLFPSNKWIEGMYLAHDLEAIGRSHPRQDIKNYLALKTF